MANLSLKNISKEYDKNVHAVKNFNLEINNEELVVLVGPSGCGKSTLLRMIAGLEEITSGDLFIDGQRVNDIDPKDRDIAMVFQNYALYPHLNVYDNLSFSLKIKKVPKEIIQKTVNDVSELLGLSDLLDRKPSQLSGGQKQRVALGRAIVRKPRVFLMDEPLSNLDAQLRAHMRTEIIRLHQELCATIIYVTHDQTEAMTMGDKIVVLKNGMIQQIGTPDQVYRQPANRFVAEFIETPTINIIASDQLKEILPDLSPHINVGIRPENIDLVHGDAFQITLIENLGSSKIIHLQNNEIRLTAKTTNNQELRIHDRTDITIHDPTKLNFFDIHNGESIQINN